MSVDRDFQMAVSLVSMEGTLALGRQVLWALFLLGLSVFWVTGDRHGLSAMVWAVAAMGLAYFSQAIHTSSYERRWLLAAAVLQGLCILAAFGSGWHAYSVLSVWVP